MENLKIRVNNEAESKEVKRLGHKINCIQVASMSCSKYPHSMYICFGGANLKEITLPELRALVSLHKNPINMDKVLNEVRSDALGLIGGAKEYLVKTDDGYSYAMASKSWSDNWIEIPEGAEVAVYYKHSDKVFFWKDNGKTHWGESSKLKLDWYKCDASCFTNLDEFLNEWSDQASVVWQRHTHQEELPFVDDEPSLNDQYAEIEKVRKEYKLKNDISVDDYINSLRCSDAVNHPSHYTSDPSGIECIEITRHRNFNIGNAIKYLWRNGLKDSDAQIQDLEKSIWYIQDEIKRLSKQ